MARWVRGVRAVLGSVRWTPVLLLATAKPLVAQAHEGAIVGQVLDSKTGAGIEGARILLVNTPLVAASGAEGRFLLANVEPGRYQLRIAAVGYAPDTLPNLTVSSGDTARVVVSMHAAAVALPGIIVTASRRPERVED